MSRVKYLLDTYSQSHRNPLNKRIHWLCVPLIMFSLLGMLWSMPWPAMYANRFIALNWAWVCIGLSLLYYVSLSLRLAAGMLLVSVMMAVVLFGLDELLFPLWQISLAVFVIGWIGQFIGHSIEGQRPSFFEDLRYLLIGPLWVIAFLYRKMGIDY